MNAGANAMPGLHSRLVDATLPVGESALSTVLMIDDRRFPWVLLVPRVDKAEEIHHLERATRTLLMDEIAAVTAGFEEHFAPFRINVADIGNRVAQLHIHIVARRQEDALWPKVVWSQERIPYATSEAAERARLSIVTACTGMPDFVPLTSRAPR